MGRAETVWYISLLLYVAMLVFFEYIRFCLHRCKMVVRPSFTVSVMRLAPREPSILLIYIVGTFGEPPGVPGWLQFGHDQRYSRRANGR